MNAKDVNNLALSAGLVGIGFAGGMLATEKVILNTTPLVLKVEVQNICPTSSDTAGSKKPGLNEQYFPFP
jgi:predicted cobalt transporter CbtA